MQAQAVRAPKERSKRKAASTCAANSAAAAERPMRRLRDAESGVDALLTKATLGVIRVNRVDGAAPVLLGLGLGGIGDKFGGAVPCALPSASAPPSVGGAA